MGEFWFDGRCCLEFGMVCSGFDTYNAPQRDVETVSVAGRNGDLVIDKGRYKNIMVPYEVSICRDFEKKSSAARAWLCSKAGYKRLEDSYHPDSFRLAMFAGPVDFDVKFLNRAAESKLQFNCKPQRFLKSGEHPITFTASGNLYNYTAEIALPIIRIYGTGTGSVTVGGTYVQIKELNESLVLDCDLQNAYRQLGEGAPENWNSKISVQEFPKLAPGENVISFNGDVTRIEIIPRWWET